MDKQFISAIKEKSSFEKHIAAPYLRKAFVLDFIPEKASISICGIGFYSIFLNGKEITKGALAPYISNPDHYCYFDTYNIINLLVKGENVIGIILGNGFNNPFGGAVWGFDKAPWVSAPKVSVDFKAESGDKTLTFSSDESFKTHSSPIIFDELRMGEYYDANNEIDGWNEPGFDDSNWKNAVYAEIPRGEMKACRAEPVRVIREVTPVNIIKSEKGYIYDFGENNAGVCRLKVRAEKNQKIEMYHAEVMEGNEISRKNISFSHEGTEYYDEYNQKDIYIAKGEGEEVYTPRFTYHGFRYVEVRGITEKQATPELLTYCIMRSDVKTLATFTCSDDTVNKLFEMGKRSDEANFYYFNTDCPHREKNGWTGDVSISADHLALMYDVSASWREWLNNIRKAQGDDGRLPGIVPNFNTAYDWGNGPAWDSVIFNLPYELYRIRGELEVVKENAHAMMRYLEYVLQNRNDDGTVSFGLGDFHPVGRFNTDYTVPVVVTSSIMVMDIARKASEMFKAVGYLHQADFAYNIYQDMRSVIRKQLVDMDSMVVTGESQSGQAMAIYYGVFENEEKQRAFDNLIEYIHRKNDSFDCGCLGMHTIFHVLSDFGESELAFRMITKKEYPSYGYLIELGETSLVESFRENGKCGSHNHHFFGDISRWFINCLAGLCVTGKNKISVKPAFVDSMEFASASCELPGGMASVAWKRIGDAMEIHVNCDKGIEYTIELPKGYKMENGLIRKS